ncbi:TRAP transporter substrate-binding protein DctP [Brucella anthropi]|uniref:TRAP transporter substrate-binding protein DctP n=1 Tax=Brucella anthropi TaxID=529 RepID=UPI00178C62C6|nr:TRAP transporter substrate-binding protein DctP [Brucella anthropi]
MRNRNLATLMVSLLTTVIFTVGNAVAKDFRLSHSFELSHPMHIASVEAAEFFKTCTGGQHTITIYPASQLGSETSQNQLIRAGGLDILLTGVSFQYSVYKPIAIVGAPFIFTDRAQAVRYRTSPLFREVWTNYEKQTGSVIMSAGYFGAFNVTSNTPLEKLEDFRGFKVRVPDSPVYLAFPKALGANASPITLAEVYIALQNGTVSGSANPLPMTYAFKFYEVQKYVNPTAHMHEYILWLTHGPMVKGLDASDRDCMQKAADIFAERSTAMIIDQEENLRAKMESEKLIKFSNPDIVALRKAAAPTVEELAKQFGVSQDFLLRLKGI